MNRTNMSNDYTNNDDALSSAPYTASNRGVSQHAFDKSDDVQREKI